MISFLYQVAIETKRTAVYVANSTRLPYLDIKQAIIKFNIALTVCPIPPLSMFHITPDLSHFTP